MITIHHTSTMTSRIGRHRIFTAAFALLVVSCESFVVGGSSHKLINQQREIKTTTRLFSNKKDTTEEKEGIEMKTWNPLRLLVLKASFTEPMWSSPLNREKREGAYSCAFCGNVLFDSSSKYDSGSGWPSFWRSHREGSMDYRKELDGRLECRCGTCKSHLGHVFPDGPKDNDASIDKPLVESMPESDPRPVSSQRLPRFCVNGASLTFSARED